MTSIFALPIEYHNIILKYHNIDPRCYKNVKTYVLKVFYVQDVIILTSNVIISTCNIIKISKNFFDFIFSIGCPTGCLNIDI